MMSMWDYFEYVLEKINFNLLARQIISGGAIWPTAM